MEKGRKGIVEFLFSSKMQFNSIQRYEIEKKKFNGKQAFKLSCNFQLLY